MTIALSTVTVNCADPRSLAGFYAALVGGSVKTAGEVWARVTSSGTQIDFQRVTQYVPPAWPASAENLLHLDFLVDDLAAAVERAVDCGAVPYAHQPNDDHCMVLADPAGHPFCLTTWADVG